MDNFRLDLPHFDLYCLIDSNGGAPGNPLRPLLGEMMTLFRVFCYSEGSDENPWYQPTPTGSAIWSGWKFFMEHSTLARRVKAEFGMTGGVLSPFEQSALRLIYLLTILPDDIPLIPVAQDAKDPPASGQLLLEHFGPCWVCCVPLFLLGFVLVQENTALEGGFCFLVVGDFCGRPLLGSYSNRAFREDDLRSRRPQFHPTLFSCRLPNPIEADHPPGPRGWSPYVWHFAGPRSIVSTISRCYYDGYNVAADLHFRLFHRPREVASTPTHSLSCSNLLHPLSEAGDEELE